MPSRSSAANPMLRRSKSSVSVQTRRRGRYFADPIENEADQRQAQKAASLAMQRAARSAHSESHGSGVPISSATSQLSRTRSIRFSESDAIPRERGKRNPIHMRQATPYSHDHSVQEEEEEEEEAYAPDAFRAISEFGMLNDDIPSVPSVPSSYRKLRKSKSMFSTRLRSGWSHDGTHSSKQNQNYSQDTGARRFARTTLRRSMSFFKGDSESRSRRHQSTESYDEPAVKLARDQFLRDLSRTSQSDTVGSSFRMRKSRDPRPFRKTVRSLSATATTYDSDSTNYSVQGQSRGSHRGIRTKLLSQTIKNGLRRMFKRSGSAQTDGASQQKDAQFRSSDSVDPGSQQISELGNTSVSNSPYGQQDNTFDPYSEFTGRRPASIRSMKSIDSASTSASRVTSWTNSTATNTIAKRRPRDNRLSIIEENGALDLSAPTKSDIHYHDGYSAFRQPLRFDRMGGGPVDSQRVYSALMRKIDSANAQGGHDGDITPRPSSVELSRHLQPSNQSIRHVPSATSMGYGQAPAIPPRRSPSARSAHSTQSFYTAKTSGLTPQQIAQRNEHITHYRSQQSLRRLDSNTSRADPYRHSMSYDSDGTATPTGNRRHDFDDDSTTVVIVRSPSDSYVMSPSVYSRTTSGDTPSRYGSRHNSSLHDSDDDRGTATIMTSQRLPYTPRGRDRLIRGSAEWKSWMKSQMDLIDLPDTNNGLDVRIANIERGHYREDAQIHDDSSDAEDTACPSVKGQQTEVTEGGSEQPVGQQQASDAERPPLSELKYLSPNNFSRPLRQSPEVSVSFGTTNVNRPSLTTEKHTPPCSTSVVEMNLQSKPSTGSIRLRSRSGTPSQSPLVHRKTRLSGSLRSPTASPLDGLMNFRNSASTRSRYGRNILPPLYGGDIQTGPSSIRAKREDWSPAKENRGVDENEAPSRSENENMIARLNGFHSTISSKRMVDLFLNDRRRMMGGSEDSTTDSAFL